jgi:hypothetical protein
LLISALSSPREKIALGALGEAFERIAGPAAVPAAGHALCHNLRKLTGVAMTKICTWLFPLLLLSFLPPLPAADVPEWFEVKLKDMEVKARLVRDTQEITALLGSDLDSEFILIELDVKPLYGAKIELNRDDFLMRTYRNNETSVAQSPDRIAGGSELVLGKAETLTVGIYSQTGVGIPVGGAPGTGTRPRRIGGDETLSGGGVKSSEKSEVTQRERQGEGDLLSRLQARELPIEQVDDIVHGYLYFQLSPKEKPKNLTLNYDGEGGEFQILFGK